ncbi:uncharacterized protein RJT20DRAFT_136254 [Scheffersomyces xylosifermentans]|uniref:uncharacterized protein n=1 Tax=Scheffersomyces xylosifermentans TaxID=1304137 RepID=UPI00315DCDF2
MALKLYALRYSRYYFDRFKCQLFAAFFLFFIHLTTVAAAGDNGHRDVNLDINADEIPNEVVVKHAGSRDGNHEAVTEGNANGNGRNNPKKAKCKVSLEIGGVKHTTQILGNVEVAYNVREFILRNLIQEGQDRQVHDGVSTINRIKGILHKESSILSDQFTLTRSINYRNHLEEDLSTLGDYQKDTSNIQLKFMIQNHDRNDDTVKQLENAIFSMKNKLIIRKEALGVVIRRSHDSWLSHYQADLNCIDQCLTELDVLSEEVDNLGQGGA